MNEAPLRPCGPPRDLHVAEYDTTPEREGTKAPKSFYETFGLWLMAPDNQSVDKQASLCQLMIYLHVISQPKQAVSLEVPLPPVPDLDWCKMLAPSQDLRQSFEILSMYLNRSAEFILH